ncbi:hypothetical protein DESC_740240 [Desulfosarcina cetonica]|nr:hypothetical protein DESC_740240 [Desulfosarcina cetonica]
MRYCFSENLLDNQWLVRLRIRLMTTESTGGFTPITSHIRARYQGKFAGHPGLLITGGSIHDEAERVQGPRVQEHLGFWPRQGRQSGDLPCREKRGRENCASYGALPHKSDHC